MAQDEFDGIDIGGELRASRAEPTPEFASRLADRVRAEVPRRRVAPRLPLAFAATVVALVVAAAFGGVSEAAYTVENAVTAIVHVGHKAKPHRPSATRTGTASASSATSSGVSSTSGSHSNSVSGPSHGGSHQPPPLVQPPTSPSIDQYNPGCTPGPRGPYVACREP